MTVVTGETKVRKISTGFGGGRDRDGDGQGIKGCEPFDKAGSFSNPGSKKSKPEAWAI